MKFSKNISIPFYNTLSLTMIVFFSSILINGCLTQPTLTKDLENVFGTWIHEKTVYSNYTSDVNSTIYVFENVFLEFTNNISNYSGKLIHFSTNTQTIVWKLDLAKDKLYIEIDITNFEYTLNLVAVDSTNVNYLWFMNGIYTLSNTNYYFFISNNIRKYVLKKL